MTTKKKGILVTIIVLILLLIAGLRIYQVNKETPQVIYHDIKTKKSAKLESGLTMKVKKATIYTKKEAQKRYGANFIDMLGPDAKMDYKTLEVAIEISNTTSEDQIFSLTNLYIEKTAFCTGIDENIFFSIPQNKTDINMTIKAHNKEDVIVPYLFFPNFFTQKEWQNIDLSKLYLSDQWYPVKNRWYLK